MTLDRLSQITEVGIKSGITLNGINVIGVVTATSLTVNGGAVVNGVVTATSFSGNVTGNITPTGLVVSGVSTFQSSSFWGDGDIAYFGDGQDLLIFHNSTDSIIRDNGTGDLNIEGGNRIKLMNPTGIETYAVFNQDGASELWYDNAKKFETTGAGVSITGIASATSGFVGNLTGNVTGNVNATGLSTFSGGPVLIGGGTSTGTASQPLQVTGGAYVSGNLGIGTTNPSAALHITSPTLQAYFEGSTQGSITLRKTGTTGFNIYTPSSGGLGFYDNVASATRVTIDSAGRVTKPYQPFARAVPPNNFSISANTETIVNGTWTALSNVGNSFNTSGGTFTAPVSGVYSIIWSAFFSASTAVRLDTYINVNGGTVARTEQSKWGTNSVNNVSNVSTIVALSANDVVTFGVLSNIASSFFSTAYPWSYACIYLLG